MTEQGTSFAFGGCRDSKNVVSEDLDWSVQLAISYKLSPFRAELLTIPEVTPTLCKAAQNPLDIGVKIKCVFPRVFVETLYRASPRNLNSFWY